jgi:hypothetical protein
MYAVALHEILYDVDVFVLKFVHVVVYECDSDLLVDVNVAYDLAIVILLCAYLKVNVMSFCAEKNHNRHHMAMLNALILFRIKPSTRRLARVLIMIVRNDIIIVRA